MQITVWHFKYAWIYSTIAGRVWVLSLCFFIVDQRNQIKSPILITTNNIAEIFQRGIKPTQMKRHQAHTLEIFKRCKTFGTCQTEFLVVFLWMYSGVYQFGDSLETSTDENQCSDCFLKSLHIILGALAFPNAFHFCSVLDNDLAARTNDTDVSISISQAEVEISTDRLVLSLLAIRTFIRFFWSKLEKKLSQIKIYIIINVCSKLELGRCSGR